MMAGERAAIKQLSDEATVRADRIALLFTILFTAIGLARKTAGGQGHGTQRHACGRALITLH